MKRNKRIMALALTLITVILSLLTACQSEQPKNDEPIRVASLTGPTSMGLVHLMEDDASRENKKYSFTIAGSADEITPKILRGEIDIASIPANLASVLYNRTEGNIQVLAVNTLGMLYILGKNVDIASVSDLKGKTIYATGKGATPEYCLRYVLEGNGISMENDVAMKWMTEPSELVNTVLNQESFVCMLPQPYVVIAQNTISGLETKLSMNDEWNGIEGSGMFITSVIAVRKEYASANPEKVAEFIEEARKSAEETVKNVENSAELIEKHIKFKKAIAVKAIPHCNIVFKNDENAKNSLDKLLKIFYSVNPASVGGKLPESDFFYEN